MSNLIRKSIHQSFDEKKKPNPIFRDRFFFLSVYECLVFCGFCSISVHFLQFFVSLDICSKSGSILCGETLEKFYVYFCDLGFSFLFIFFRICLESFELFWVVLSFIHSLFHNSQFTCLTVFNIYLFSFMDFFF